jgi:hypothetical protein
MMNVSFKQIFPTAIWHPVLSVETIDFIGFSTQRNAQWLQRGNDVCNRIYLDDFYHLI